MTPTDHYRVAEQILRDPHLDANGAAIAQVHATLATLDGAANDQDATRTERPCAGCAEWKQRAEVFEADRGEWMQRAEMAEGLVSTQRAVIAMYVPRAEKAERERDAQMHRAWRLADESYRYYRKLSGIECPHGYRMTDSCPGCAADENGDEQPAQIGELRDALGGDWTGGVDPVDAVRRQRD